MLIKNDVLACMKAANEALNAAALIMDMRAEDDNEDDIYNVLAKMSTSLHFLMEEGAAE